MGVARDNIDEDTRELIKKSVEDAEADDDETDICVKVDMKTNPRLRKELTTLPVTDRYTEVKDDAVRIYSPNESQMEYVRDEIRLMAERIEEDLTEQRPAPSFRLWSSKEEKKGAETKAKLRKIVNEVTENVGIDNQGGRKEHINKNPETTSTVTKDRIKGEDRVKGKDRVTGESRLKCPW